MTDAQPTPLVREARRASRFVSAALLVVAATLSTSAEQSTGGVSGTITDSASGAPIANVRLFLYSSTGSSLGFVSTNASGFYNRNFLSPGTYYAVADTLGLNYLPELWDNIPCSGCAVTSGTPITITAGTIRTGVNFALNPGGVVSGTVIDEFTGQPLAAVSVHVYTTSGALATWGTTNAAGVYALGGLPTGSYRVRTFAAGMYRNEMYDNLSCSVSCHHANGTPVTVTAGATTSGINFLLAQSGAISGVVTNQETGAPMQSVAIYILNSSGTVIGFTGTDANGAYTASGIVAGTYYLNTTTANAINEVYDNIPCAPSCTTTSGTPVVVTTGVTTTGVNFALSTGGTIAGVVTDQATGAGVSGVRVEVRTTAGGLIRNAVTSASGTYAVTSVTPGSYVVATSGSFAVNEVFDNFICNPFCNYATGTPVAVSLGGVTNNINFALTRTGVISGTVTNATSGAVLQGVGVSAFNSTGTLVASAATNTTGAYSIEGLLAGTYYIRTYSAGAIDELYPNLPCQPTCSVTSGAPVTVTPGVATSSIDFSLTWTATATVIRDNGPSANRIDIVVLGDGYTSADLASGKYAKDVETLVAGLFAEQPFHEYQRFFNVRRIDVVSAESGADKPNPAPGVYKNTALDATYYCGQIQRLICVSTDKVNGVISNVGLASNAADTVIVVVNDSEYGGSGGGISVISTSTLAADVTLHEVGHTLGGLADEYGGPPPPACGTTEPGSANATRQTTRALIKWNHWIDPSTPVPTVSTAAGVPGLYQGAVYCDFGAYRPTFNSKMRSSSQPFYAINEEQLVRRFYNWVSPIDAASPAGVTLTAMSHQPFSVTVPLPMTHTLEVVWHVNGTVFGFGNTFNAQGFQPGTYTVTATVRDTTAKVRSDPDALLTETRSWTLTILPSHTNVVQNGAFGTALGNWQVFQIPDIVWNITNGVMQFYRAFPLTTPSGQAVVLQNTGRTLGADSPVRVRFDLGNSSSARKRISVLLHDGDFSDLSVCTFWLPAGTPMTTYEMRTHNTKPWTNATVSFYAATADNGAGGFYQVDNVSLEYVPGQPANRTDCAEPFLAFPGGTDGPELLVNGAFSSGISGWDTFGQITYQIDGGAFEFYRPAAPGFAGVVLQATGAAIANGQTLSAQLSFGNSSSVRKRVTVLVHDNDFSDLSACTFWLPPGQPLMPYTVRMLTTEAWSNATLSVYAATSGAEQWIRFDNASLRQTPTAGTVGTECLEPGAAGAGTPAVVGELPSSEPASVPDFRKQPQLPSETWPGRIRIVR